MELLDIEYPIIVVDWDRNLVYEKDVFTTKCVPLNTVKKFGADGRDEHYLRYEDTLTGLVNS